MKTLLVILGLFLACGVHAQTTKMKGPYQEVSVSPEVATKLKELVTLDYIKRLEDKVASLEKAVNDLTSQVITERMSNPRNMDPGFCINCPKPIKIIAGEGMSVIGDSVITKLNNWKSNYFPERQSIWLNKDTTILMNSTWKQLPREGPFITAEWKGNYLTADSLKFK